MPLPTTTNHLIGVDSGTMCDSEPEYPPNKTRPFFGRNARRSYRNVRYATTLQPASLIRDWRAAKLPWHHKRYCSFDNRWLPLLVLVTQEM